MAFIISKLSSDVDYAVYAPVVGGIKQVIKHIYIKGGAGVADRKSLVVRNGVCTEVTEEELELLNKNKVFQLHKANGHILVMEKANKYEAAEKAESEEVINDASKQQTAEDFEENTTAEEVVTLKRKKSSKRKGK